MAANKKTRQTISDPACGIETLGGTAYNRFYYTQSTETPVEAVSRVTLWIDRETVRTAKQHTLIATGGQEFEMAVDYRWPDEVVLPTP